MANFIDPALIDLVNLVLPKSTNQNVEHYHGGLHFIRHLHFVWRFQTGAEMGHAYRGT